MNHPSGPAHTGLPVEDVVGELRDALRSGSSAVLTAEPGAGKTTVVPLRLLGEGWLREGKIVVLEPRRVAARAAAARMAALLGERVGETVGVVTRDDRRVGANTRIEVVTEGVLTRRLQRDPEMAGVSAVVFDEFHERSLQGDLGLALALDAQRSLRPQLRVLVMSATLDAGRLAAHLGECPVVSSPGRTFPVDVQWRPLGPRDRVEGSVATACSRALGEGARGVLAFLPGAAEIQRVVEALRAQGAVALPLHGGLPGRDQDRAIQASEDRRVVVATDLAESSLTVLDVDTVVDSGLRRTPRFHPGSGMSRLETVATSKASADQRSGRAGRLGPGRSVRLWSEADHLARATFDRPAIFEADLLDLVLQVIAWGASDPSELPFLDAPPAAEMARCRSLLVQLSLVGPDGRISAEGREVAAMGVHPRLGRMLAAASADQRSTAATLVAVLEERDVLEGPVAHRSADVDDRLQLIIAGHRRTAMVRRRARTLGAKGPPRLGESGPLLAAGFPDRIGRRQAELGRFTLTGGMRVSVADTDPLAREEWVVAADIDGDRAQGRLLRGAGLDAEEAEAALAPLVVDDREVRFDEARGRVMVVERQTVGPVVLRERAVAAEPGAETAVALTSHLLRVGLDRLPWPSAATTLRERSEFARTHLDLAWPDLSDAGLEASAADWLEPLLWNAASVADIKESDLLGAIRGLLGHERVRELQRLVPRAVSLGNGRELTVDYSGERPTVSARVQDFYGETAGPTILGGSLPLTLELLSPAGRPIQVTSDLGGFWNGSWSEVRKEMAGRYPKHDWPVDPSQASAARRKR